MVETFQSASWHRVADLKPKLRSHGTISHHRYRGRSWYVMHDPSSGRVHRFTPAAYAFVRAMDGERTVDQIWTQMASDLEVDAPAQDEIIRLLSQLFQADMLQADRQPNVEGLSYVVGRHRRSRLMTAIRNPLSVTFPLWDPESFLSRRVGPVRVLMGFGGFIVWLALVIPAVVMASLHFSDLTENITDRVLSAEGLIIISLTFPLVKLLHELGHGFALKAFGGEVHQIGLMFIAFYPVPYVEASAAAMLPSKLQRIVVGAAGMMVELVIASLAFYVWLMAEPGIVRAVAYDIILIAGISTVVVNGNPLLRFDGYFILSDLIEIPNLAQRSTRLWGRIAMRGLFGLRSEQGEVTTLGERVWFFFYGPAAFAYRMLILLSLSLFVATEYLIVGILIAAVSLVTAIVVPLWRGCKRVLHAAQLQSASRRTQIRFLVATAVASVLLFVVPAPLHTTSEGVIWLPDDAYVRAGADGFITRVLAGSGSRVDKGNPLIASEDAFLDTQIELRRQRIRELEVRLISERFANRVVAEITRAEIGEEQLRLRSDLERSSLLTAQSERAGTFVVPETGDLPGRFHRKGEVLGYVLPDQAGTIRGIVLQDNIDLVRHRLRSAQVMLASNPTALTSARIIREVPAGGHELPSKALSLSGGGAIAVDPKDSKGTKVARRIFQFDLELVEPLARPAFGMRAYVRFEHEPEPVAAQVYRRLRQLFLSRFYA